MIGRAMCPPKKRNTKILKLASLLENSREKKIVTINNEICRRHLLCLYQYRKASYIYDSI